MAYNDEYQMFLDGLKNFKNSEMWKNARPSQRKKFLEDAKNYAHKFQSATIAEAEAEGQAEVDAENEKERIHKLRQRQDPVGFLLKEYNEGTDSDGVSWKSDTFVDDIVNGVGNMLGGYDEDDKRTDEEWYAEEKAKRDFGTDSQITRDIQAMNKVNSLIRQDRKKHGSSADFAKSIEEGKADFGAERIVSNNWEGTKYGELYNSLRRGGMGEDDGTPNNLNKGGTPPAKNEFLENVQNGARGLANFGIRSAVDFGKGIAEHSVIDTTKLIALGANTIGANKLAKKLIDFSNYASEQYKHNFSFGDSDVNGFADKDANFFERLRTADVSSIIDAAEAGGMDMLALMKSFPQMMAYKYLGNSTFVGKGVNKLSAALMGSNNVLLGGTATGSIARKIGKYALDGGRFLGAKYVEGIPTAVGMSLAEMYSDQIETDNNGNVVLPDHTWPTLLLAPIHGAIEHLGIDPRRVVSGGVRKSLGNFLKEMFNPFRNIWEGVEENLQDGVSLVTKSLSFDNAKNYDAKSGKWVDETDENGNIVPNTVFKGLVNGFDAMFNDERAEQIFETFTVTALSTMFIPEGSVKSGKTIRNQQVRVAKDSDYAADLAQSLGILQTSDDRENFKKDIAEAIETADFKIRRSDVSLAEKQKLAADKLNDTAQAQNVVSVEEAEDRKRAMEDLITEYLDAQDESGRDISESVSLRDYLRNYETNQKVKDMRKSYAGRRNDIVSKKQAEDNALKEEYDNLPDTGSEDELSKDKFESVDDYIDFQKRLKGSVDDSDISSKTLDEQIKYLEKQGVELDDETLNFLYIQKAIESNEQYDRAENDRINARNEADRKKKENQERIRNLKSERHAKRLERQRANSTGLTERRLSEYRNNAESEKSKRFEEEENARRFKNIDEATEAFTKGLDEKNARDESERTRKTIAEIRKSYTDGDNNVTDLQKMNESVGSFLDGLREKRKAREAEKARLARIEQERIDQEKQNRISRKKSKVSRIARKANHVSQEEITDEKRRKANAIANAMGIDIGSGREYGASERISDRTGIDMPSSSNERIAMPETDRINMPQSFGATDRNAYFNSNSLKADITSDKNSDRVYEIKDRITELQGLQKMANDLESQLEKDISEDEKSDIERTLNELDVEAKKIQREIDGYDLISKADLSKAISEINANSKEEVTENTNGQKQVEKKSDNIFDSYFDGSKTDNSPRTALDRLENGYIAAINAENKQGNVRIITIKEDESGNKIYNVTNENNVTINPKRDYIEKQFDNNQWEIISEGASAEEAVKPETKSQNITGGELVVGLNDRKILKAILNDKDGHEYSVTYSPKTGARVNPEFSYESANGMISGKDVKYESLFSLQKEIEDGKYSVKDVIYKKEDKEQPEAEQEKSNYVVLPATPIRESVKHSLKVRLVRNSLHGNNTLNNLDEAEKKVIRGFIINNNWLGDHFQVIDSSVGNGLWQVTYDKEGKKALREYLGFTEKDNTEQTQQQETPKAEQPKAKKSFANILDNNKLFKKDDVLASLKALHDASKRIGLNVDPNLIQHMYVVGCGFAEAGVRKFVDFCSSVKHFCIENDMRDIYNSIKPKLKRIYYNIVGDDEALEQLGAKASDFDSLSDVQEFDVDAWDKQDDKEFANDNNVADKTEETNKNTDSEKKVDRIVKDYVPQLLEGKKDNRWVDNIVSELGLRDRKEGQEYIEAAIAKYIHTKVMRGDEMTSAVCRLITENQPRMNERNQSSKYFQAYSTPIRLANMLVDSINIKPGDVVYEPTAGTGLLVSSAKSNNIILNEIQDSRYNLLKQSFPNATITKGDALAEKMPKADVVLTNPPFGSIKQHSENKEYYEYTTKWNNKVAYIKQIDHAIALKALDNMADNGKAIVIVGGVLNYGNNSENNQASSSLALFNHILNNDFNVVESMQIGGKIYESQGTKFPILVYIINGKQIGQHKSVNKPVKEIKNVNEWSGIAESLQRVRENFSTTNEGSSENNGQRLDQIQGTVNKGVEESNAVSTGETYSEVQQRSESIDRGTDTVSSGRYNRNNQNQTESSESEQEVLSDNGEERDTEKRSRTDSARGMGEQSDRKRNVSSVEQSEQGNANYRKFSESGRSVGNNESSRLSQSRRLNENSQTEDEKVELDENLQSEYKSLSRNGKSNLSVIPKNLKGSVEFALKKLEDREGDLTDFVNKNVGRELTDTLFKQQNDALALAIDNQNKGEGMVIGDDTGTGKGCISAGLVASSINNGRIPVFCTNKPGLFSDIIRDFRTIEFNVGENEDDDIRPLVISPTKTVDPNDPQTVIFKPFNNKMIANIENNIGDGKKYNCIFVTYDQLSKGGYSNKLNPILSLGNKIDLILDEAHCAASKIENNKTTAVLENMMSLTDVANSTVYLSATWLKNLANIPLYRKAFPLKMDPTSTVEAIKKSGVNGQEVFSDTMSRNGKFIRREHSYKGVQFDRQTVTKPEDIEEEAKASDNFSDVMMAANELRNSVLEDTYNIKRDVDSFVGRKAFYEYRDKDGKTIRKQVEITNDDIIALKEAEARRKQRKESSGIKMDKPTNPFSIAHNYLNAFLLSRKIDSVADQVVEAIRNNEKPVITLQNTMESMLQDFNVGDTVNITFSNMMDRIIGSIKKSSINFEDPYKPGAYYVIPVTDDDYSEETITKLSKFRKTVNTDLFNDMPASPIDMLIKLIEERGSKKLERPVKVGEITGRQKILSYNDDGSAKVIARNKDKEKKENPYLFNNQTVNGQENDGLDCLIINTSACNGISLHASEKYKNQNQRIMFIIQPIAEINNMIQALGRIMRAGQVKLPKYVYALLNLMAENRIANNNQAKINNLMANTTSNKKSNRNFTDVDRYNHYGDTVAEEWCDSHLDIAAMLDLVNDDGEYIYPSGEDDTFINKVAGKVSFLHQDKQIEFWDFVTSRYAELIEDAKNAGTYDLDAISFDNADAVTIRRDRLDEGDDDTNAVYREEVEMNYEGNPITYQNAEYRYSNRKGLYSPFFDKDIDAKVDSAIIAYETQKVNSPEAKKEYLEMTEEQKEKEIKKNIESSREEYRLLKSEMETTFAPGSVVKVTYNLNTGNKKETNTATKIGMVESVSYSVPTSMKENPLNKKRISIKIVGPEKVNTFKVNYKNLVENASVSYGTIGQKDEYSWKDLKVGEEEWNESYEKNKNKREKQVLLTGNILESSKYAKGKNNIPVQIKFRDGISKHAWLMGENGYISLPPKRIHSFDRTKNNVSIISSDKGTRIFTGWGAGSRVGVVFNESHPIVKDIETSNRIFGRDLIQRKNGDYKGWILGRPISDEEVNKLIQEYPNEKFYEDKNAIESNDEIEKLLRENDRNSDDDEQELFSIAPSKVSNPISSNNLRRFLSNTGKTITKNTGVNFAVYETVEDMKKALKIDVPGNAEGAVLGNTIHIVRKNIAEERLEYFVAHELAGHLGVEALLGNGADNFFKQLRISAKTDKFIAEAFKQVDSLGYKKNREKEAMAKIVEKVKKDQKTLKGKVKGFVNHLIAKVKNFLRKMGFRMNLSEADVYDIAVAALRKTENPIKDGTNLSSKEIMFSESENVNDEFDDYLNFFNSYGDFGMEFNSVDEIARGLSSENETVRNMAQKAYDNLGDTVTKELVNSKIKEVKRENSPETYENLVSKKETKRLSKSEKELLEQIKQRRLAEEYHRIKYEEIANRKKIAEENKKKNKKQTIKDWIEKWEKIGAQKFANSREKLESLEREVEKRIKSKLSDDESANRAFDTMDGRIQTGIENFKKKYVDPLLKHIAENKITYDDFNMYVYAMHVNEREEHIRKIDKEGSRLGSGAGWQYSKYGNPEAYAISLENKYGPALREAGEMFWKMNRAKVEAMRNFNILPNEIADVILNQYKYYTPLKRIQGDETSTTPNQRAKGRVSEATDHLMFAIADIDSIFRKGEYNKSVQAFYKFAQRYPSKNNQLYELGRANIVKRFKPDGTITYEFDKHIKDPNTIYVGLENGSFGTITIHDKDLMDAFRKQKQVGTVTETLIKASRAFVHLKSFMSTMSNPEFGIPNFIRDTTQSGAENLIYRGKDFMTNVFKHALPAIKTYIDNLRGIDNEDTRLYKEFLAEGGMTGYADILRLDERAKNLKQQIEDDIRIMSSKGYEGVKAKSIKAIHNKAETVRLMFTPFEIFNDALESATRFSVYKESRKTMSARRSAEIAKNITINFNRHGSYFNSEANAIWMFANASIQGTRKSYQLYKEAAKTPFGRKAIAGVMLAGFFADLLAALLSGLDPDDDKLYYDSLEDKKKDNQFIFMMPNSKNYISIPLPPVLAFPYMIGRNMSAMVRGNKTTLETVRDMASNTVSAVSPFSEDNRRFHELIPTAAKPLIDLAENKDWTGNPIVPGRNPFGAQKPLHTTYKKTTSEAFVKLAEFLSEIGGGDEYNEANWALEWSPSQLEYLANEVGGGTAKFIGNTIRTLSGNAKSINDVPVARRFYNTVSDREAKSEYYENSNTLKVYNEAKNKNNDYLNNNPNISKIGRIIKTAEKDIEKVKRSRSLTDSQKDEYILRIKKRANASARKYR